MRGAAMCRWRSPALRRTARWASACRAGGWRRGFAAHGAPIPDLPARVEEIRRHRKAREAAILQALSDSPDLQTLQHRIYADLAPALQPAARRNLLAHLFDLVHRKQIMPDRDDLQTARFTQS